MRVSRLSLVSVLAVSLLVALPLVAHAEVETPPPGWHFPSGEDIARPLLAGLQNVLINTVDFWWDHSAPVVIARAISLLFGALVAVVWWALGPLLQAINFYTRLPPAWSYELGPVVAMRRQLLPLASATLVLGLVLGIGWGALSLVLGRPFGRLLNALPTFLLATAGLVAAPQLTRWLVDFANAISDALLSPGGGLPGLDRMGAVDRLSALGVVTIVYLLFALWFLLFRLKLLVIVAVLLVVMPLAIVAGALPFPQAQRFFSWWGSTLVASVFVQVLQAVCLGIGAAMITAPVVTGGDPSNPLQDLFSGIIGVGAILAAASFPGMLLGALSRTGLPRWVGQLAGVALQVASVAVGVGVVAPVVARYASIRPPMGLPAAPSATTATSGYVRSLLADAPAQKLLPPPPRP